MKSGSTGSMANYTNGVFLRIDAVVFVRIVLIACVSIEILLVLLDAFLNYGHMIPSRVLRRIFNIAREDSLASWFSITQTAAIAAIAGLLWFVSRDGRKRLRFGWILIALFFLYLAADDAAEIHERIGTALKSIETSVVDGKVSTFFRRLLIEYPSYEWHALLPIYTTVGLAMMIFLWNELGKTGTIVGVVIALGCFVLAIGLDIIEGVDGSEQWLMEKLTVSRYTTRHFSKALEEFLEMLGMTFILVSFLKHLGRLGPTIKFGGHVPQSSSIE